ncbi:DUF1592 domain-containing protein [Tundrisphaera sp. TA3]|uniref:DUF1592 domain-containing protein n=1 Tax=Tundrisphaera sp. TA3 TaxID=3435775 RepID=UPI003EB99BA2
MKTINARGLFAAVAAFALAGPRAGGEEIAVVRDFLDKHCAVCHDDATRKGGLDLTGLAFDLAAPGSFARWVTVHDRVARGEMPPKKSSRPHDAEIDAFARSLGDALAASARERAEKEGRATRRRLNRYEYENALRDLLGTPWLQIKDALPEDGEAHRFNKSGDALDVSHVQMARYLGVADDALRRVMADQVERPATRTVRYYARQQRSFTGKMKFSVFNQRAERATFPTLGSAPQPDVRAGTAPMTVGKDDPETRELEGVGVVASTYEPLEIKFNEFRAPRAGRYRLRFNAQSVWVGPGLDPKRWYIPDLDNVSAGRRPEPITIYSEIPPGLLRRLGTFDAAPEPGVHELEVDLLQGETIRPDAARLFRSRPPAWINPLAEKDGCPGVTFRWMEVEGPILESWPTPGHQLLFGDLPLRKSGDGVEVVPAEPMKEAERLLRRFARRAYRRPVPEAEEVRFLPIVEQALRSRRPFADAMIAGYTAVLCSPEFVCLEEKPGRLDDHALAARLSFFLHNSEPDAELRALADRGELGRPEVLRAQAERLLDDPKSRRFVEAFLDYWIDLRKVPGIAADELLYADYYLDDLLTESALEETRRFFGELIREDLPARNVVASDFAMVNERLAAHYGLPPVDGVAIRKVNLPPDSPRGGLMTQASVLMVTANGTTTSPVLRGVWVMERILGQPLPPPPPGIPAVEPDIRGATTIREQLDKHRNVESCAGCHRRIDPAGFALESFDVMGGWRDRYRALADKPAEKGRGKNGQPFAFRDASPVEAGGVLPDGRSFRDIRELKQKLADDEEQLARNLAGQFVVYATGTPVGFADRPEVERILARARDKGYGVRSLIHEIIQADLFRNK